MSRAQTPFWPLLRSEYLFRVREAFRAHSKSLRHRCFAWSCARGEQDGYESIEFTFERAGPLLRLKVWEDGAIWFCARQFRAGRVSFQTTFHAVARDEDPARLVESTYRAFLVYIGSERADANSEGYVAAFDAFSPYDVRWRGN